METKHIIIAIVASAFLSAACTAAVIQWQQSDAKTIEQPALIQRINKLEAKLAQEQQSRELLQDIISQRTGTIAGEIPGEMAQAPQARNSQSNQQATAGAQQTSPVPETVARRRPTQAEMNAARIEQAQPAYQIQRLVNSGFSTEEATWVIKSESEVALRKLGQDYEQRRATVANQEQTPKSSRELLRQELGDDYYERYLKANGYPTNARIDEVMIGSPGANAGLRPGDKITAYDGRRVFNLKDVNTQTVQGTPGQSVLIEVVRNGEPVQLTIPRGPIGVSGGRGR